MMISEISFIQKSNNIQEHNLQYESEQWSSNIARFIIIFATPPNCTFTYFYASNVQSKSAPLSFTIFRQSKAPFKPYFIQFDIAYFHGYSPKHTRNREETKRWKKKIQEIYGLSGAKLIQLCWFFCFAFLLRPHILWYTFMYAFIHIDFQRTCSFHITQNRKPRAMSLFFPSNVIPNCMLTDNQQTFGLSMEYSSN